MKAFVVAIVTSVLALFVAFLWSSTAITTDDHSNVLASLDITELDEQPHQRCALASPRCSYRKTCRRFIVDEFISDAELDDLRQLASEAFNTGKPSSGGVQLADIVNGVVTYENRFADMFILLRRAKQVLPRNLLATYGTVLSRIQAFVSREFAGSKYGLAKPAFFSNITNASALTVNDEYWHVHIDTAQYGSFDITTLLYLSSYEEDMWLEPHQFSGGTFDFVDAETDDEVTNILAVPPLAKRLLVFTSGREHPHKVSPVSAGERIAVTTAWTCDPSEGRFDNFLASHF